MENDSGPRPAPDPDPSALGASDSPGSGDVAASYDPLAALADVDAARGSVADRLITPWWYHPALGAIIAAIVLAGALDSSTLVRLLVALVGVACMGVLVNAYQRMTGLWVDLRNLGPSSRKWWLAYAAVIVVVVGASLIPTVSDSALPTWLAWLLAAVALVATIVLGRGMDRAMREEIRSGVAALPKSRR